jgi:hypothetical protein
MADVVVETGSVQKRVHCSDEVFLEAVYSSKNYAEIAEKTGQKIPSTMARYARVKNALKEKGIDLPAMERRKPVKTVDNVEAMADIVRRLQAAHAGS